MKRSAPRKRRRGVRRGAFRSLSKRKYVGSLPSLLTGQPAQCCHVLRGGMAQKCGDEWTVPLSPSLHDQLDGRVKLPDGTYGNRMVEGKRAFEWFYRVDLVEEAIRIHLDWMQKEKEQGRGDDAGHRSSEAA